MEELNSQIKNDQRRDEEISVDCLIMARFVMTVPLPDSPAWDR